MIIFDVLHWCYQTRQRGGMSWYCSFSLVSQCETVLSLIFSENTDIDALGDLKKPFIFNLIGRFLAYIEIRSTFFLDKLRMVVLNEKMGLNHVFTIQMGLEGLYAWLGNIFLPFLYNFTLKNVNFPCLVWLSGNIRN